MLSLYVERCQGPQAALRGSYTVADAQVRTAFDVFAESLADMTPEAAAEIAGVPAETIRKLGEDIPAAARLGTTTRVGDVTQRYRSVAIHTWRGLAAKEYEVQNWRAGLMLLGNPDAVGGLHLHGVYKKPAYFDPSKCEYPPKRVDLAKSVYFPNGQHDVCQQVALTLLDPKAYELRFMASLCHAEDESTRAGLSDEAAWARERQVRFAEQHLLAWIPGCCMQIAEQAREPLYRALAKVTGWVITEDARQLRAAPAGYGANPAPSGNAAVGKGVAT